MENRYISFMAKKKKDTTGEINDPRNGQFVKGNQAHTLRENVGRPKKLPRFLEAFKCVLDDPHPVGLAIICTDDELRILVNERLDESDHVSAATFSRWKSFEWEGEDDRDLGEQFKAMYRRALIHQKKALFERMLEMREARSWGRISWIIERKFDEWNLRTKSVDETPDMKSLVLRLASPAKNGEAVDGES